MGKKLSDRDFSEKIFSHLSFNRAARLIAGSHLKFYKNISNSLFALVYLPLPLELNAKFLR
jgi:hypothetical protein